MLFDSHAPETNHVIIMTLCTEILAIVNNLHGVHVAREDTPYDTVERLTMRVGSRIFRLTLITADVCTCHAEVGNVRHSFRTAHEFANFMQEQGATLSHDAVSSDIGYYSDSSLSSDDTEGM